MDFINWPVAAAIVMLVFMVLFRKPISGVLERTKNVSVGKVGLQTTLGHGPPKVDGQSQAGALLQAPDSEVQAEQETAIRSQLDQIGGDPKEREDLLVRDLASARARESLTALSDHLGQSADSIAVRQREHRECDIRITASLVQGRAKKVESTRRGRIRVRGMAPVLD